MPDGQTMRRVLLEVIEELSQSRAHANSLQSASILEEAARRLNIPINNQNFSGEQALLTLFHDLFRNGHLAWGLNLANASPPFCHVTLQGRNALRHYSRDPANPDGYMEHLAASGSLNPIASSYISEALATYNADCFKAAAVMVGAAAESVILELRDVLKAKIDSLGRTPPKDLLDWQIKRVIIQVKKELDQKKGTWPHALAEMYDAYWSAFAQQIRAVRNEAGHPNSISPVTYDAVHASLLIFPELAKLAAQLRSWISTRYT